MFVIAVLVGVVLTLVIRASNDPSTEDTPAVASPRLEESPPTTSIAEPPPESVPPQPWCVVEASGTGGVIMWEDNGDTAVLRRNGEWFQTPDARAEEVQINSPINVNDQYVLRLWKDDESRDIACSITGLADTQSLVPESPAAVLATGNPVPVPERGAYIGMNTGDFENGITVEGREALFGQELAIERVFYPPSTWSVSNINIDRIIETHNAGRIPMVSYATKSWKDVASGRDDAIIDNLADQIKASEIPILLTIDHEPDEEACLNSQPNCGKGQTSQDFVNMWRRVHDRFEAKGVNNVSWNWIVMGWEWGPTGNAERQQIVEDMFPGVDYVDWLSADLYNDAGSCSFTPQQIHDRWSSLEFRGQGWYDWASQFGKPLALGEWGTYDDVLQDGRKAQWLRDAGETIKQWDNIKAAVYFDRLHEGCDWRLTTGGDAELAGYRDVINDPHFIKG